MITQMKGGNNNGFSAPNIGALNINPNNNYNQNNPNPNAGWNNNTFNNFK